MVNKESYDIAYGILKLLYNQFRDHDDIDYHLKAYVDMFSPIPKDALLSAHRSLIARDKVDKLTIDLKTRAMYTQLFGVTVAHNPMLGRIFRTHERIAIEAKNNDRNT